MPNTPKASKEVPAGIIGLTTQLHAPNEPERARQQRAFAFQRDRNSLQCI
jgi:hypothetical protein